MIERGTPSPTVAVVVPLMDRADDLRPSLATITTQDYPELTIYIVDMSSTDGAAIDEIVAATPRHDRIVRITCPRPPFFSFSKVRNTGARYTQSDLLLFLNADNVMRNTSVVSDAVGRMLGGTTEPSTWYAAWRRETGRPQVRVRPRIPRDLSAFPLVFGHCLGSPILVARDVFQSIGGYNESLTGWGYEDTDLVFRLECCGLRRFEITGVTQPEHDDEIRMRNFRVKDKTQSWTRNLRWSELYLRYFGPVVRVATHPGVVPWIEVGDRRIDGRSAPQQPWSMSGSELLPPVRRAFVSAMVPPSLAKTRMWMRARGWARKALPTRAGR